MRRAAILLVACLACGKTERQRPPAEETPPPPPAVSTVPPVMGAEPYAPTPAAPKPPRKTDCPLPKSCGALVPTATSSIRLHRSDCMMHCPVYAVTLYGDGKVEWQGEDNVAKKGAATGRADAAAVRALFADLGTACFFAMENEYHAPITDHPYAELSVTHDGKSKTVTHTLVGDDDAFKGPNMSCFVAPALERIEPRIDKVAKTAPWIGKRR